MFYEEWYLETNIWVLPMFIVIMVYVIIVLLICYYEPTSRLSQWTKLKTIHIYINQHVGKLLYLFIYLLDNKLCSSSISRFEFLLFTFMY